MSRKLIFIRLSYKYFLLDNNKYIHAVNITGITSAYLQMHCDRQTYENLIACNEPATAFAM